MGLYQGRIFLTFTLLELALYLETKYFLIDILNFNFGASCYQGSLLMFEYHGGDILWDFFFLNTHKPEACG